MRPFLAVLLTAAGIGAQGPLPPSSDVASNCYTNQGGRRVDFAGGPTVRGIPVDFVVQVREPGTITLLLFGVGPETTSAVLPGVPLPIDLGIAVPALSGCLLHPSGSQCLWAIAGPTEARFTLFVPGTMPDALLPILVQGVIQDTDQPLGWNLTTNAILYFPSRRP
jgi:hypothetical protein